MFKRCLSLSSFQLLSSDLESRQVLIPWWMDLGRESLRSHGAVLFSRSNKHSNVALFTGANSGVDRVVNIWNVVLCPIGLNAVLTGPDQVWILNKKICRPVVVAMGLGVSAGDLWLDKWTLCRQRFFPCMAPALLQLSRFLSQERVLSACWVQVQSRHHCGLLLALDNGVDTRLLKVVGWRKWRHVLWVYWLLG